MREPWPGRLGTHCRLPAAARARSGAARRTSPRCPEASNAPTSGMSRPRTTVPIRSRCSSRCTASEKAGCTRSHDRMWADVRRRERVRRRVPARDRRAVELRTRRSRHRRSSGMSSTRSPRRCASTRTGSTRAAYSMGAFMTTSVSCRLRRSHRGRSARRRHPQPGRLRARTPVPLLSRSTAPPTRGCRTTARSRAKSPPGRIATAAPDAADQHERARRRRRDDRQDRRTRARRAPRCSSTASTERRALVAGQRVLTIDRVERSATRRSRSRRPTSSGTSSASIGSAPTSRRTRPGSRRQSRPRCCQIAVAMHMIDRRCRARRRERIPRLCAAAGLATPGPAPTSTGRCWVTVRSRRRTPTRSTPTPPVRGHRRPAAQRRRAAGEPHRVPRRDQQRM